MGITRRWGLAAGVATVAAAVAIGAGVSAADGGGSTASPPPAGALDSTCVLGVDLREFQGPSDPPWLAGLMARSDGLNREYRLGRYAEGGACAQTPDWFRALVLRSDALNRAQGLGPYGPAR